MSESLTNTDVLNSWKEVAVYMGRGVRTVQRWERELGLPVRRPRGRSRSAVIAFKPELDRWLAQAPTDAEELRHPAPVTLRLPSVQVSQHTTSLTTRNHQLLARSHDLRQRTIELCIQLNRNLEVAHNLVDRAFPTRSHALRQRTMELCIQLNRNLELAHNLVDRAFPASKSFLEKCG